MMVVKVVRLEGWCCCGGEPKPVSFGVFSGHSVCGGGLGSEGDCFRLEVILEK